MKTFEEFLTESPASDQAKAKGLKSVGFGRFANKAGKVVGVSKFGKFVDAKKAGNLETLKGGELKHLEHADDEIWNNGHHGVRNVLDKIHAIKHGDDRVKVSTKMDGSPSVVLGQHHETGKFFVASKSAFNATPKINYTEADIDKNHGHAPGLCSKLKELLKHGPKMGIKGIVQGDLMYGENDRTEKDGKISFKPNTIRYSINKAHPEGKKIAKSKIGIALHTRYNQDKDGKLKAELDPNIETKAHPDVYVAPVAQDHSKAKVDKAKLTKHASEIGKLMHKIPKEAWGEITHPDISEHVKTYINAKVRKGETNHSHKELIEHIHAKFDKEAASKKSEKGKAQTEERRKTLIDRVKKVGGHIDTAFRIQEHINHAKHHIIDHLDRNANELFDHSYDEDDGSSTPAKPEGHVVIGHAGPLKFVDRQNFSAANFRMSANRK